MAKQNKSTPTGWTSAQDAAFDRAIKKVLPPKDLEDHGHPDGGGTAPARDDHRGGNPLNRATHTRQKKV